METKTLAVISLWRNSESYIERSLSQFDQMHKHLKKQGIHIVYGFFENDSTDSTAQILQAWLRTKFGFVISETIGAPKWGSVPSLKRVKYQARYRNIVLDYLNNHYSYDYLLIADSDVYWEPSLIKGMISRLDENASWGMVSPNTLQNVKDYVEETERESYYDSWSLVDSAGQQCLTFAANPFLQKEDRENWENKTPVRCNSAFGSIAMTKAEAMEDVEWDVIDGVEHWEFCRGIRDNGYLVIADPTLEAIVAHEKTVVPFPEVVEHHQKRLKESQDKYTI
jgi:GT2 family glycosyltransferase